MASRSRFALQVPPADRLIGTLSTLLAVFVAVTTMRSFGVGLYVQVTWLAGLAVTVLLPGYLVSRRFPSRSLPGLLGIAFVTGTGLQIAGLALADLLHLRWTLWIWPLLLALIAEAAVRRRRGQSLRHGWGPAAPLERTPWWASAGLLAAWVSTVQFVVHDFLAWTPLDRSVRWHHDMDWQLSVSGSALRGLPVQDAQSASDGMLSYHWFGNAHIAASTITSGGSLDQIGIVAWQFPVLGALLLTVYGFARWITGRVIGGVLAALFVSLPPVFLLWPTADLDAAVSLTCLSQSHIFSLPILTALTWAVVYFLGQRDRSLWTMAFLTGLALLTSGAKVSAIPTLLGGIGFVFLASLRTRRDAIRTAAAGGIGVVIVLATASFFAGGGGGSSLFIGATPNRMPIFKNVLSLPDAPSGVWGAIVVLLLGMVEFLPLLLVLGARRNTAAPTEPGAALPGAADPATVRIALLVFGGMTTVALGAYFFLNHPSASQIYFVRGMAPVTAVFLSLGVTAIGQRLAGRIGPRKAWIVILAALAAGALFYRLERGAHLRFETSLTLRSASVALLVALALAAALVILLGTRRKPMPLAAALLAFVVLGFTVQPAVSQLIHPAAAPKPIPSSPASAKSPLSADEIGAGQYVTQHNVNGGLIATNVHCTGIKTTSHCDTRSFWVAAVTNSPVDIGAWAYSSSARRRQGVGGLPYTAQPYADQNLYLLNEKAFSAPTPEILHTLKDRGVEYLYADRRASAVSPALVKQADRVWSSPTVDVYRLK